MVSRVVTVGSVVFIMTLLSSWNSMAARGGGLSALFDELGAGISLKTITEIGC